MKRLFYVCFLLVASTSFASAQTKTKKISRAPLQTTVAAKNSAGRTPAEQKAFEAKKVEMEKNGTALTANPIMRQPTKEEMGKPSKKN